MLLISHRGNIAGRIEELENSPEYIDSTIRAGYDVEIDAWVVDGLILLGHDEPTYPVDVEWLRSRTAKLWIHCKNIAALELFGDLAEFHYFWHEGDTVTLTSRRIIWAYPGKQPIKDSIAVMPETCSDDVIACRGVCSDHIERYRNEIAQAQ